MKRVNTAGVLTAIGLGLTPFGWVVLIGAAVVVGYHAAKAIDSYAQAKTGQLYDRNLLGGVM